MKKLYIHVKLREVLQLADIVLPDLIRLRGKLDQLISFILKNEVNSED